MRSNVRIRRSEENKLSAVSYQLSASPHWLRSWCKSIIPAFVLLIFFHSSETIAQGVPDAIKRKVDTLAVVNGQPITSEDFKNRFDLSIYPGEDYRDTTKMEFLFSMIAEKLLSAAASSSAEPMMPEENLIRNELEEMFLRDALYRSKVLPETNPTDAELAQGAHVSTYSYVVDAFYLPDSSYATRFYDLVTSSRKNIYVLAESLSVDHDTLEIAYGESTAGIEEAFFGHTRGYISKPTLTVDGWVIFKVLGRKVNPKFAGATLNDKLGMIRRIIQGRKEDLVGEKYLLSVMKNVRVNVNYALFRPLVYSIQKLISQKHPESFDPYYYLSPQDLSELRHQFRASLSSPLLSFEGGDLTLSRVIDNLTLAGFHSADTTIPQITVGLHSALRFISQNYFLAKRARDLGLQNSGEVRYNVRMFLDAYRSSRIAQQVTDTVKVTPQEVDEFFETHRDEVLNGLQLKLKTYEVASINDAVDIYEKLLNARKAGVVDTSGSWTRASQLGEIGAVLGDEPDGTIYGPLFENGKFVIYQVIEKKSSITKETIAHSIEVAKQMLTAMKREQVLDEYVAALAEKANVKMFYPNVRSVEVTPIEMLTFRYIGFGGKIIAVPELYPREGWIKYFQNKKPPVP